MMAAESKRAHNKKTLKWMIILLLLIIIILLISMCTGSDPDRPVLVPDSAPTESEPNTQTIPGDTGVSSDSRNGGGSVSLRYSNQVSVDLPEASATLYFANPKRSNQDLILQIVIQEEVIVQSGRIPAGYKVESLPLLADAVDRLRAGGYEGKFVIYYYDQQEGQKATVNTEIPIHIIVKDSRIQYP